MSLDHPQTPAKAGVHGEPGPPALWLRVKAMGACLAQAPTDSGHETANALRVFRLILGSRQS